VDSFEFLVDFIISSANSASFVFSFQRIVYPYDLLSSPMGRDLVVLGTGSDNGSHSLSHNRKVALLHS
jgi:hypothetical protein